jgi:hypothetical protein
MMNASENDANFVSAWLWVGDCVSPQERVTQLRRNDKAEWDECVASFPRGSIKLIQPTHSLSKLNDAQVSTTETFNGRAGFSIVPECRGEFAQILLHKLD